MALGTPTDGGAAYSASGGTTVAPAYPAVSNAGDCLILIIGMKPSTANGGTVTTPTGWTLRETLTGAGGYGATLGADTGNTNLWIYTKNTVTGAETGNLTVTIGTNNVSWGLIVNIPTGGGSLLYGSADGSRTTAPTTAVPFTTLLTNGTTAPALQSGDMALWAMCIPTDVLANGFTAPTISSTGTTFGTPVELEEPDSGTGSDIGGYVAYALATAGTSAAAPTVGVTATGTVTNVRGPIALLRVREIAALTLIADPTSYAITGTDATLLDNKHLNADPSSYAVTGADATFSKEVMFNAESGSYSLTGFSASLLENYNLNAEPASYALTGSAVTFEIIGTGKEIIAEVGIYSINGNAAQLAIGKVFNAEAGSYAVTGIAANLEQSLLLSADPSSYNLSGANATFTDDRVLSLDPGSYSVSGADASFTVGYAFNAETGAYVVTGDPVEFAKGIILSAESAAYDITGFDAEINRSGSFTADAGDYALTGQDAVLARGYILNAEPATEYVEVGYVDPGYVIQTGYYVDGFLVTFMYPRYPLPNEVLAGVMYGPNGDDYVGTYVCPVTANKQLIYIFDD